MALFQHGFLGAEAEETRQQILQKYADLFGLLKELNAVCHEYMTTVKCNWQSRPTFQAISYHSRIDDLSKPHNLIRTWLH